MKDSVQMKEVLKAIMDFSNLMMIIIRKILKNMKLKKKIINSRKKKYYKIKINYLYLLTYKILKYRLILS